jgi:hypothetical protein
MPPAFAIAIDNPGGHAPAIGASKSGSFRPYLEQNAACPFRMSPLL